MFLNLALGRWITRLPGPTAASPDRLLAVCQQVFKVYCDFEPDLRAVYCDCDIGLSKELPSNPAAFPICCESEGNCPGAVP